MKQEINNIIRVFLLIIILAACSPVQFTNAELGENAYSEGRFITALHYFTQAIYDDPSHPELYLKRGRTYSRLNQSQKAIDDFSRAARLQENYEQAILNRGIEYLNIEEYQKALSDFNRVIQLNDQNGDAFFNCAFAYALLEDYQSAIDNYSSVIEIDSNNVKAIVNRANIKGLLGDHAGTIEDLTLAIEIDPENETAYFNRATEYLVSSNDSLAINDLKLSVKYDPGNLNTLYLLGETQLKLKRYENASSTFNKIIQIDSSEEKAYFFRGISLLNVGDKISACTNLIRAGELGYFRAYNLINRYCKSSE